MLVDHERVLHDLKRCIASKTSHGRDALLAEIGRLEATHTLEEGLPERALRLYGLVFGEATRPSLTRASGAERVADGPDDKSASGGADTPPSEEDTDGDRREAAALVC